MKKWFLGLCLVLQTTEVFAQRPVAKKRPVPVTSSSASRFELSGGLNITSYDYREELPAPFKSTEKGIFYIPYLRGRIFLPQLGESFVNVQAEYSGNVLSDFDGSDTNGNAVKGTNAHAFFQFESDFYWEVGNRFFLYSGVGYRYWNRFLNGGSGYREIYTWGYLPIGLLYEYEFNNQLTGGVDLSARMMFNGKIEVIFSETVEGGDDNTLNLGNKTGYKLQFPLKYQPIQSALNYQATPWYEFSEIGESNEEFNSTRNAYIHEPASKTYQYGLTLGLGWKF